jgi:hypothetical protein
MDPESERSSAARKWWLLIGGIVVFVVAFSLLESLVRTEPAPSAEGSTPAGDPDAAPSPPPPELRRLDDGAIEIRHDFFRRSTIRLGNEDDEKALFDCLAQGIEQTFADGTAGWDRARVRRETQRIQDACLGLQDIPTLPRRPRPPQPGTAGEDGPR